MRAFWIGLQFLTRICIVKQDNWTEEDFGKSVKFFPAIGAVLGIIYSALAYLMVVFLPEHAINLPKHFTSVVLLITPMLLTGGLHCDGFMDTMDGLFSGRSRERMLEIMKDSRVGSNGVVGYVLLTVTEWAIILDMQPAVLISAFFVMPVIARLMMAGAIKLYPYARPEGMGKSFVEKSEGWALYFAIVTALIFILPIGVLGIAALIITMLFAIFFAGYAEKRLGGLTGDLYGAITTLSEFMVLVVFLFGSSIVK